MAERVSPRMSSRTLVLELERFDAAFTHPLFAQLDQLGDKACLVAIGSLPGPSMLMHDAAVALPVSSGNALFNPGPR